ncbi:TPA: hypothetical protein ACW6D3_001198 [Legionella pneumophila]
MDDEYEMDGSSFTLLFCIQLPYWAGDPGYQKPPDSAGGWSVSIAYLPPSSGLKKLK